MAKEWETEPRIGPPGCHARPPPFRGPRAPLSVGGPVGARGWRQRARARAPPLPAPLQGSGLLCCLPHPPHWSGRGVPEPPGPEGEGCEVSAPKQAPPPRGGPLKAFWGDWQTCARPPSFDEEGRKHRVAPSSRALRLGGGTRPPSPADCLFHAKGEGQQCCPAPPPSSGSLQAPPPGPGVGGTRSLPLEQK